MTRIAKKILDFLPFNGQKTIIGAGVVVLDLAAKIFPQFGDIFHEIGNTLGGINSNEVNVIGISTLVVGLVHKVLKATEENKKSL